MKNEIGPYEKKLKADLEKSGCTLHVTSTPGADSETVAKEILEIEEAFKQGKCIETTNRSF